MTKKVFVIGSGAREHAIVNSLLKNEDIDHIYIYPGNDGIVTSKVSLSKLSPYSKDFEDFCKTDIDLVVPGQEDELVNGIVDNITKLDIDIFGPTQEAARIEGSKEFAKRFMMMNNIPTSSVSTEDKLVLCAAVEWCFAGLINSNNGRIGFNNFWRIIEG